MICETAADRTAPGDLLMRLRQEILPDTEPWGKLRNFMRGK